MSDGPFAMHAHTVRCGVMLAGCVFLGTMNLHAWFAVQRIAANPGILSYMDFGKGRVVFSLPVLLVLYSLASAWCASIFYLVVSDRHTPRCGVNPRTWPTLALPFLLTLGCLSGLALAHMLYRRADIASDSALLASSVYPIVTLILWGYSTWRLRGQWLTLLILLTYALVSLIPAAVVFSVATRL